MWFFKHVIIRYTILEPKHTIFILKLKYKLNTSETSSNIIIVLKVYSNRVIEYLILVTNIVWRKTELNTRPEKKELWWWRIVFIIKSWKEKYKIGAENTWTFTKVRDRIRFYEGVIYPLFTGHTYRVLFVVIGKHGKNQ